MTVNNDINGLYKLTPGDVEQAIKVAGDAFQDDPVTIFTYPDEMERKEKIPYGFYMIYRYGITPETPVPLWCMLRKPKIIGIGED